MLIVKNILCFLLLAIFLIEISFAQKGRRHSDKKDFDGMVLIPAGEMIGFEKKEKGNALVKVNSFLIDALPVTNEDFLQFAKANPVWRKNSVKKIFADRNYLTHWLNDSTFGSEVNPQSPVVNVSWYAVRAYAKWKNKRLLTTDEWEYVALTSQKKANGKTDDVKNKTIIDWYSKSGEKLITSVGMQKPNYYKVYDLHGLIWEWVTDFNSNLVTGESRGDKSFDSNLFCGAGSKSFSDVTDYASFMRYAFRGSLKAEYTVHNLGFRCAKNLDK
jgi:formylglycine-generating enzyme required for sulfatase activity